MTRYKLLLIVALSLVCGVAQAQRGFDLGSLLNAGKDVATATTGISEKEEIQIGRELAGRILGQVALVDDANVQAYVNRVGRWIASQSERPDIPWRFGVANALNINAMAMPGGTILITRGLYDLLDNEAQLAGVLGHEIGHVIKKHHISVMQKQALVSAGANLAASRSGNNQIGKFALDKVKEMFLSGLDKDSEYEADAVGVILAARAGYNAFGLAEVLHKLNARAKGDESVAFLFATHPAPSDRLTKLGDLLTPRMSKLPSGIEPEITPVAEGTAAPTRGTAPTAGARSLTNEKPAAAPAANAAPAQKPALDAGGLLQGVKGLFGR